MICSASTPGGSQCCLQYGHDCAHRAEHGFEWTDADAKRWAANVIKDMEGRR